MLKRSNAKSKTAANDPFCFQGDGVDFKGKFIGERDVNAARGDGMCAEAMRMAKAAIKSSGSHKQRIILNISVEGLRIKEEKSGAVLFNFPVSKISFIARDTTDSRAFGFVFGTQDGKYKFYGIKTAQTADNTVLMIRDMFQVVFEMKKKQIKEAKEAKLKNEELENLENSKREEKNFRIEDGVAVADLLDLETELENIQQGVKQLETFTLVPEDNAWPTNGTNGKADPFADAFFTPAPQQIKPVQPIHPVQSAPQQQNGFWSQPTTMIHASTNPFVVQSSLESSAFTLPPPPRSQIPFGIETVGFESAASSINGQSSPEVQWSSSSASSLKENASVPMNAEFDVFNTEFATKNGTNGNGFQENGQKITTLEEAFNKLVDVDKLFGSANAPVFAESKKNPFENIINPPQIPLNAIPTSIPPRTQHQLPTAVNDPFRDPFFS